MNNNSIIIVFIFITQRVTVTMDVIQLLVFEFNGLLTILASTFGSVTRITDGFSILTVYAIDIQIISILYMFRVLRDCCNIVKFVGGHVYFMVIECYKVIFGYDAYNTMNL